MEMARPRPAAEELRNRGARRRSRSASRPSAAGGGRDLRAALARAAAAALARLAALSRGRRAALAVLLVVAAVACVHALAGAAGKAVEEAVVVVREEEEDVLEAVAEPKLAKMPVYVVEQHGNVLGYWVEALRGQKGVSVVHIDSHSDMMDVEGDDKHEFSAAAAARMFREILADAAIGDFITRAVVAGIVDMVHWLRSDFAIGMYNGPAVGHFSALAGIDSDEELACFAAVERWGATRTAQALLQARAAREGVAAAPQVETSRKGPQDDDDDDDAARSSRLANELAESLDSCEEDGLLDKYKAPVEIVVSTLDAPVAHARRAGSPWILDIDFDYLATNDPCIELFEQHGFSLAWVQEHVQGALSCPSNDEEAEMLTMRKLMLQIANRDGPSPVGSVDKALREASTDCEVASRPTMQRLMDAVLDFDAEQRQAWRSIFRRDMLEWSADFVVSLFDGSPHLGPIGKPSPKEVRAQAARLETWIRREVALRGPPVCVTLSKSHKFDHYLPTELAGLIQNLVFGLVRRVFARTAFVYHEDFDRTSLIEADPEDAENELHPGDADLLRGSLFSIPAHVDHDDED